MTGMETVMDSGMRSVMGLVRVRKMVWKLAYIRIGMVISIGTDDQDIDMEVDMRIGSGVATVILGDWYGGQYLSDWYENWIDIRSPDVVRRCPWPY